VFSEGSLTILNRMLGNVSSDLNKSEGNFVYDSLSPASIEIAQQGTSLDAVVSKFDIENLSGDELALRIYQRTGKTRNEATFATATVTITGTGTISIGDLVQTPGGIRFKSLEQKVIITTADVDVQAVVAGASGMVPANQITQFPVAIAGLISVTNADLTQDGFDAESDASLLQRYYDYVKSPATGGNIAQFVNLIKDYDGVGDVKVYPTWDGNNTVKLVIIDANKLPPSTEVVDGAQAYMDPLGDGWGQGYGAAPYGAFTTVEGAAEKIITVGFTATKDTNYTDEQRQTNVEASLVAYFKSIAFVESAVSYAKIGAAVLSSAGVLDYTDLTVNTGTANIALSYTSTLTEAPVLGVVTIA